MGNKTQCGGGPLLLPDMRFLLFAIWLLGAAHVSSGQAIRDTSLALVAVQASYAQQVPGGDVGGQVDVRADLHDRPYVSFDHVAHGVGQRVRGDLGLGEEDVAARIELAERTQRARRASIWSSGVPPSERRKSASPRCSISSTLSSRSIGCRISAR